MCTLEYQDMQGNRRVLEIQRVEDQVLPTFNGTSCEFDWPGGIEDPSQLKWTINGKSTIYRLTGPGMPFAIVQSLYANPNTPKIRYFDEGGSVAYELTIDRN